MGIVFFITIVPAIFFSVFQGARTVFVLSFSRLCLTSFFFIHSEFVKVFLKQFFAYGYFGPVVGPG